MAKTQLVVVCQPSVDGTPIAPCGSHDGQAFSPVIVEQPVLSAATVSAIEAAAAPFDYAEAGQLWSAAFGMVVLFFATGIAVGTILRVLRD